MISECFRNIFFKTPKEGDKDLFGKWQLRHRQNLKLSKFFCIFNFRCPQLDFLLPPTPQFTWCYIEFIHSMHCFHRNRSPLSLIRSIIQLGNLMGKIDLSHLISTIWEICCKGGFRFWLYRVALISITHTTGHSCQQSSASFTAYLPNSPVHEAS